MSKPSRVLPTDPFELALDNLIGLTNGAHTAPVVVQSIDFYGNATQFILQTVRTDQGRHAFITQVNAGGSARFVLPPEVLRTLDRQADSLTTMVRRRHGKRLAETQRAQGRQPVFTPEMRAKALATRKANAAKRKRR